MHPVFCSTISRTPTRIPHIYPQLPPAYIQTVLVARSPNCTTDHIAVSDSLSFS